MSRRFIVYIVLLAAIAAGAVMMSAVGFAVDASERLHEPPVSSTAPTGPVAGVRG